MKCDSKTMIKVAVASGLALAVAYFALPAAHAFILASAPFLIALICPVAMLFMMKSMNANRKDERVKPGESQLRPEPDLDAARKGGNDS